MNWYIADAPIRLKLALAFGTMAALVASTPLAALLAPGAALPVGAAATVLAIGLGLWFRRAIATPYVTTVLRMESLAAGDLASPIQFTDYRDCVGRMTKAMFAFREGAETQRRLNVEAEQHGAVVRGMAANFRRLADGDLGADIVEDYPVEYVELKDAFNTALAALRAVVANVADSSSTILTGSDEIAGASEQLARRTESTAAGVEQTNAAIGQMDVRLKATAEAAGRTVERADSAIASLGEGRSITDEAVQAMTKVAAGAKGIDDVIEGLDKIAFQTRVLAMNAAVEAGRAGEAGRGFAVVADLVSALAMRAEEEAGRARGQLTTTQEEINAAVAMVARVDTALGAISDCVGEVHGLLGGIAEDNQAQAIAIGEIRAAIGQMDNATQQNAAMVEESSAASAKLREEAQALSRETGRFRIGQAGVARRLVAA